MHWELLKPFFSAWSILLALLFIHIGWINCRWKLWQWPEATYHVAILDPKTRNDFWHMVVNAALIAAFIAMIFYVLGRNHV